MRARAAQARPAPQAWAAIACVLSCGCGTGPGGDPHATPSPPAPKPVVIAVAEGPKATLPHLSNDFYTQSVLGNVYEPLVELDSELTLRPRLAESWHTPDELTWVFRLRQGVRFSDGRPLTAAAAARAIQRTRDDPQSRRRAELVTVAAVEAPDEATLVLRTRFPFGPLPNRLASVAIFAEPAAPGGPSAGTGPYLVRTWQPETAVTLEAFAGYAGAAPTVRQLEFRVVPDAVERLRPLARGDVHVVPELSPRLQAEVERQAGARVVARRGLTVHFLVFDTARESSPYVTRRGGGGLRDLRVRRAIARAIDRRRLVEVVLAGRAEIVDQVVGPQVFGFHRSLAAHPHDVAEARRLFAAAGLAAGFAADLDYNRKGSEEEVAAALAEDLKQLGLEVRPRPNSKAELVRRVEQRDTSLCLMRWIGDSGDAGLTAEYLLHSARGGYGIDNAGGYSNPELDLLLEEAARSLNARQHRELLERAAEVVQRDVPVVPLFRQSDLYAVSAALEFAPRLDQRVYGVDLRRRP